ncbi:MAG: aldehyde ferredoxin oxidoreductase family protein [Candidatus Bathyarchaeia archaeon]
MFYGWAGLILEVDLTNKKIVKKELSKDFAVKYLGSRGFASRILYERCEPNLDPLSQDNPLIFSVGPITGMFWPTPSRYTVAAKSPLTGALGYANSAGHFGPELKYAGYDMIIIKGSSKDPVYLSIMDDHVELKPANHLWGKNVWEVEDILIEELGDPEVKIASIGQAGENLVKYACVINDFHRAAGRTGMGAVMGSKKLKAIAVRGTKRVKVANPEKLYELASWAFKEAGYGPKTEWFRKWGTPALIASKNIRGDLPAKNHQLAHFPWADEISGETIRIKYLIAEKACFGCPVHCSRFTMVNYGPYAGTKGEGPEYETLDAFGPMCWNPDFGTIAKANTMCNQYGLDTMSTGVSIAFAMECYEKGILTKEELGDIDLSWGNTDAIIKLVEMITKREGIGNILAEGVKRASEIIGKGSEKYAMHVKGLEISAQDGRAQKSMAIAHAASVRGADHLRHCAFYDEVGFEDAIAEKFGKQYLPEMADRLAVKYKGFMAKETEDFAIMVDSLPLCVSGGSYWPPVLWWEDVAKIYQAVTGIKSTEKDLRIVAERVVNLKRAYNIRLCLDRRHDTLPTRFLEEPAPDGPCKGQTVDLKTLLDDYYKHRGWDIETGLIPESKLKELGLDYVAKELRKIGKLPKTKS